MSILPANGRARFRRFAKFDVWNGAQPTQNFFQFVVAEEECVAARKQHVAFFRRPINFWKIVSGLRYGSRRSSSKRAQIFFNVIVIANEPHDQRAWRGAEQDAKRQTSATLEEIGA